MPSNLSKVFSAELDGIDAKLVEVETDLHVGLHAFAIVGLGDKAVSEAKERVTSALKNSGIKPPTKENRKVVVNLAPAELKKGGSQYDLAIALGYMLATKQLKSFNTENKLFVGALAFDGSLRPINGVLNFSLLTKDLGYEFLFVPRDNAEEAAIIDNVKVVPIDNLKQLIEYLEGRGKIGIQPPTSIRSFTNAPADAEAMAGRQDDENKKRSRVSIDDIRGQENAKRALLVAAAGGHNILMEGVPGGGKTMLAQALVGLLPSLSKEEIIEVTRIYSAAGLLKKRPFVERPFRNPHHNASLAAIAGGGSNPKPGEISLAHRGVLFLDELPEFRRDALEALRQPLESRRAIIARVKSNLDLPADFMLVAAMNPCPCGYKNDDQRECTCTTNEALRYQKKISGPLMDRIDIQITVPRVELEELRDKSHNQKNSSTSVQNDILKTRELQIKRQGKLNAQLTSKECEKIIKLNGEAENYLQKMFKSSLITARGYYRLLKMSQTIADLAGIDIVNHDHISEAFGYRLRDRST
ncbi:MAG: YifB family Mg chelatase-like AAA ATPase [Patescibacteria group bacterium]